MKITENSLFCAWDAVKEQNMEITYENGAQTTRLVKHVEWDNFPVILLELQRSCCGGDMYRFGASHLFYFFRVLTMYYKL